jgi:hypothetical protein
MTHVNTQNGAAWKVEAAPKRSQSSPATALATSSRDR